MFEQEHAHRASLLASSLGKEFIMLESNMFSTTDSDIWYRVTGKINSEAATVIKLSDKFLSDRMRISYISDALKDRYRV